MPTSKSSVSIEYDPHPTFSISTPRSKKKSFVSDLNMIFAPTSVPHVDLSSMCHGSFSCGEHPVCKVTAKRDVLISFTFFSVIGSVF